MAVVIFAVALAMTMLASCSGQDKKVRVPPTAREEPPTTAEVQATTHDQHDDDRDHDDREHHRGDARAATAAHLTDYPARRAYVPPTPAHRPG